MQLQPYMREDGLAMMQATIRTNDFTKEHPELQAVVTNIMANGLDEDLTLEVFDFVADPRIELNWEKARWVAETLACLMLADIVTAWGCGYRSDDGSDYMTAALDNVRFLTDIDLDEAAFTAWWNADPYDDTVYDDHYMAWGACDGELRFILFPDTAAEM